MAEKKNRYGSHNLKLHIWNEDACWLAYILILAGTARDFSIFRLGIAKVALFTAGILTHIWKPSDHGIMASCFTGNNLQYVEDIPVALQWISDLPTHSVQRGSKKCLREIVYLVKQQLLS